MWQSATVWAQPVDAEDILPRRDQITSSPLPPTAVPVNSHLQNRGPSETDPDGPAAMVTGGARHLLRPLLGPDFCWLCEAQRSGK